MTRRPIGRAVLALAFVLLPALTCDAQTVTTVNLEATDTVYDPFSGKVYASIGSNAMVNPNTVVPIDPVTGTAGTPIPVSGRPNRLAVSDDGQYLYVGVASGFQQIELRTGIVHPPFFLGPMSCTQPLAKGVRDIEVRPGHPETVAVVQSCDVNAASNQGVAIYDNGVRRATTTAPGFDNGSIEFDETGEFLFGAETYGSTVTKLQVTADGVTVVRGVEVPEWDGGMLYVGGRIYTGSLVMDAGTFGLVGKFGLRTSAVDTSQNVAYQLDSAGVYAFDTQRLVQIAFLPTTYNNYRWDLVTAGPTHLAFHTLYTVYLITLPADLRSMSYPIRVDKAGTGTGTVSSSAGLSCGTWCSTPVAAGTSVTLTAVADAGSVFDHWEGDCATGSTITMAGPRACTAVFTNSTRTVPVRRLALQATDLLWDAATGRIYAALSSGDIGNTIVPIDPVSGQLDAPTWVGSAPVKLAKTDDGTSLYVGLEGELAVKRLNFPSLTPDIRFSIASDGSLMDTKINVLRVQPGNGRVVAVGRSASLGVYEDGVVRASQVATSVSDRSFEFNSAGDTLYGRASTSLLAASVSGAGVQLTTTTGSVFSGSGSIAYDGGRLYANTGEVVDPAAATRLGTFAGLSSTAVVAPDGAAGLVYSLTDTGKLAAYDMSTYRRRWAYDIPWTSSLAPTRLARWGSSGLAFIAGDAIYIADVSSLATMRALAITKAGTGSGTVAVGTVINCGSTCAGNFTLGETIGLAAMPTAGSVFTGWSGDADCADGQVTIADATSCTATFTSVGFRYITITKAGGGAGTVTSNPAGLACGQTCWAGFTAGGAVTLTASPSAGSAFAGWSGACQGRDPCTLTLGADAWVTAVFVPTSGDLDGDGLSDIVWHHATRGEVWLWPMIGTTMTAETYVETVADTSWEIRGVADFDGDHNADILWRNRVTGQIYLWPMDGSTVLSQIYVATVDPSYDIAGSGDYNGDGKADILWRHATNGQVWIWLMDGATPLSQALVSTVDPTYAIVGSGDLNGDRKADIVWRHTTTGTVWVWLMNGTSRTSQTQVATVADLGYQVVGVADFDGNGKADILWHHATRGEVWIWPMNGATLLGQSYVDTVPDAGYQIVATGDCDGDGKADILWHHATLGEVWVWLMDGVTRLSQTWVGTVPDVEYQIVKTK